MTIRTPTLSLLTLLILFPTMAAANDEPPADGDTWLDHRHKGVSKRLDKWSNRIDDWFGEPNPDHPADANLRLMLETEWNPEFIISGNYISFGKYHGWALKNKLFYQIIILKPY